MHKHTHIQLHRKKPILSLYSSKTTMKTENKTIANKERMIQQERKEKLVKVAIE